MNDKKKDVVISRLWFIATILFLVVVNVFYSTYFINDAYPSHNTVSNLVMASAPVNGLGFPYKDYWDIYPPGIFIFLTPFVYFFDSETIVLKIAHLLFAVIIGVVVLKLLLKIFSESYFKKSLVTSFFLVYLVLSNYYYCILFHNAFLALFVSVMGLWFLVYLKNDALKYFSSSFLFAFSASMKETYLFLVFLPVLYILAKYVFIPKKEYKLFFKNIVWVLVAVLTVLCINYFYLSFLGVNHYYEEVSLYKSQLINTSSSVDLFNKLNPLNFYDFSLRFNELMDSFFRKPFILTYCLFLFMFISKLFDLKFKVNRGKVDFEFMQWSDKRAIAVVIFGFLLLNFEGVQLLNKYQPNYTLQMVPAIVLAFSVLYQIMTDYLRAYFFERKINVLIYKAVNVFILLVFGVLLLPKHNNFSFFQIQNVSEYISGLRLKKPNITLPEKVKELMKNDNRIFYIYGWGTPYFYHFCDSKPFSRFFVLHYNILGQQQIDEFVEQFKNELPKVILYSEYGADMDTQEFESNTVCFKNLINKCYDFYPATIHQSVHCEGYYLLRDEAYFKLHSDEFLSQKYLKH